MALAESLQEVMGEAANVADLANAAFSETLADYPNMELQWMHLLHHSKTCQVSLPLLSPPRPSFAPHAAHHFWSLCLLPVQNSGTVAHI